MRRHRFVSLLAGCAVLLGPLVNSSTTARAQTAPAWEVIRLQGLHEADPVAVSDINGHGQSTGASGPTPVVWDVDGNPTALPLPEGFSSASPTAINDDGDVVGIAFGNVVPSQGIIWRDGVPTLLGEHLYPRDVNESEVVTGYTNEAAPEPDAEAWVLVPGEDPIVLADGGSSSAQPAALTDWGFVVGTVFGGGPAAAAGWYGPYAFPLAPGYPGSVEGIDVTNRGHVLVQAEVPGGEASAILTPGGGVVPLAYGGRSDAAVDLNERGVAVGQRFVPGNDRPRGVLYAYGSALPLDDLTTAEARGAVWDLDWPQAVNDDTWIVGMSWYDQHRRGWLVRPPQ